jgi:hypothetical protein
MARYCVGDDLSVKGLVPFPREMSILGSVERLLLRKKLRSACARSTKEYPGGRRS